MYVNAKMIPRKQGRGIKENSRGGELKYDIFDAL
jgi:hypothetical protein